MKIIPVEAQFCVSYKNPFSEDFVDAKLIWYNFDLADFGSEWNLVKDPPFQKVFGCHYFEEILPRIESPPSFSRLHKALLFVEFDEKNRVEITVKTLEDGSSEWSVYFKGFSSKGASISEALSSFLKTAENPRPLLVSLGVSSETIPEAVQEFILALTPQALLSKKVLNLLEIGEKLPHVFGASD